MSRLAGKTCLVTGAARGLGEAIALILAREGAAVWGCDVMAAEGEAVAAKARADGLTMTFRTCDITRTEEVNALVGEIVAARQRLDVLVNNAAVLPDPVCPLPDYTDAQWSRVIAVNVGGAFRLCRAAIPVMAAQGGGAVIGIASVHVSHSLPGYTAYAASKGALVSMSRQLAVEFGPANIRFNTVSPGAINAPMTKDALDADPTGGKARLYAHMHALDRLGDPEEVAATVAFLASDGAAFITGEDILVDGGLTKAIRM
jgi:NAD(P)-dependent dehydrogenase (short-subunit alcohol dehydrogenase family)